MTMKEKIRLGAIVVMVILVLLFVAFNFERTEINIIIGKVSLPKAIVIIGSFAAGVGVMWLLALIKGSRKETTY